MREEFIKLLTVYEGAVQEANDGPDDDEFDRLLTIARDNLMQFLIPIRQEIERRETGPKDATPITVTLRSNNTSPIRLKLNTWKYKHAQNDTPEEFRENQRYFYNKHTCPTNWIGDVVQIECAGDTDPHGVFEFVSVEDGHFNDEGEPV